MIALPPELLFQLVSLGLAFFVVSFALGFLVGRLGR